MTKKPDIAPCPFCSGECKVIGQHDRTVVCSCGYMSGFSAGDEPSAIRAHNKVARRLDRGRVLRVLGGAMGAKKKAMQGLRGCEADQMEGFVNVLDLAMDKIREMKP